MNFSEIIKASIYDLKFRHRYDYKFYWAQKIATYLSRYDKEDYRFVLAPSHSAEHLMLAIAKQLMYAYQYKVEFILYKKRNIQQKNLDKAQRMIAQKDNIYLKERDKGRVIGRKWVVLDDIYTTGSTLYYCTKVLMDAGALEVESVSLALVSDKI
ncbi:ComF family protein [Entomospira culicis]|uniref:ComF family protein n=1 Tax=Entomospira culicis TaxID=2719989 RepID=A0A968GFC0_9SPIO|nr:phosphoribosyltransferase family protein [Entomospira culicis]NIZ19627.1 ComF family protein [Entomospira culicis]NIZ69468.1 ComF family protein [Entomospira culicis]WDI36583.1 phosphoribosyltransferase family protein [Entomospira culicis]WDI38211.1 phosphoribosyltransferase family protein [Entomospira culicis]